MLSGDLYGALRVAEAKLDQHHNSKLFETVKSEARIVQDTSGYCCRIPVGL